MSKIKVEQISETEVEIQLSAETPMEMVNQLSKSLNAKGFVEDLSKSIVSKRLFYKPEDSMNQAADALIKSLEKMADKSNPYSKEAMMQAKERNRMNDRRAAAGIKPTLTDAMVADSKNVPKPKLDTASPKVSGPSTLPGVPNKLHNKDLSGKVNYTKKSEHPDNCSCRECKESRKNDVMKKAERKLNWNQGDLDRVATNFARAMSDKLVKGTEVAGKINEMYNSKIQLQPTDQELFGRFEVTEEMAKQAQSGFNNKLNDFFAEASKPLSSRFASAEEEAAYWDSIPTSGNRDDGKPGF
jgi:hypothetical protein